MTEKKGGHLHYGTAASRARMPHKMSPWMMVHILHTSKEKTYWCFDTCRLPLDGKSKICSLVANTGGKNKTTKLIQTTKETSDHHSHLLLSEYEALWPTSLSGPLPRTPPCLTAGSTEQGSPEQESCWCSANTRVQWELLFWSMTQLFKEDYTNFPALSVKILIYSCDCGKFVAFIYKPKGSRD